MSWLLPIGIGAAAVYFLTQKQTPPVGAFPIGPEPKPTQIPANLLDLMNNAFYSYVQKTGNKNPSREVWARWMNTGAFQASLAAWRYVYDHGLAYIIQHHAEAPPKQYVAWLTEGIAQKNEGETNGTV